jgi:APA family basic amino acid/polyamine antiporter
MYQLVASTVVVGWSKYVWHFIHIISDFNATNLTVHQSTLLKNDTDGINITCTSPDLRVVVITIAITIILISGIRQTATINLMFVILKIIALLIFIFACSKYVNLNNYKPFFPPKQGT